MKAGRQDCFPVPDNARGFQSVPLIVTGTEPQSNLRHQLEIPDDAFVLGTLSAPDQFDIPFVRRWIPKYLDSAKSNFILLPNIKKFLDHPRALFLPRILGETMKADYLQSLDAMLHGRLMGESFGLAVCEALNAGRPVFSWSSGRDRNHVQILRQSGWLYRDQADLDRLVSRFAAERPPVAAKARELAGGFQPAVVSDKFVETFGLQ
jgi:glycosyltransferase involved in cell wall biosynthesis